MTYNCILVHYHEISLKGDNRKWFERIFIKNVKENIRGLPYERVIIRGARLFIFGINPDLWNDYSDHLRDVMGLSNATLISQIPAEMPLIKSTIESMIAGESFENFRISARRQYKNFPLNSMEINQEVGRHIQKIVNKPVKLKGAELDVHIEIVKGMAYIGFKRITGFGGLPVGVSESAVSLLSSGIDSPVSSFSLMKRGVYLSFVHFHSAPATNRQSINNVISILKLLSRFQRVCPLYLIPLLDIQQKIMSGVSDKYWVILFRRAMVTLAANIAEKIDAPALVTGESVGQVASQTLSNIRAVADAASLPILRPLSGMNKDEIIDQAKLIGTYPISIEPYQDCCSFFVPVHPETKANLDQILNIERSIDLSELLNNALERAELIKIDRNGIISNP